MDIDHKSAKLKVDIAGSEPDTDISADGRWAFLHLKRNADLIVGGNRRASDADKSAIGITGEVEVKHSASEDLSKCDSRFIQLACPSINYALYAGPTSRDGFLSINYAAPPAYPQKFAYEFVLDAGPEFYGEEVMPFVNPRMPVIFPKRTNKGTLVPGFSIVVADMDDHPSTRMSVVFDNKETGKLNYLAQAIREVYFLTAFVYRDEKSKIEILAHVSWRTLWKARYHWVGGNCIPYPVTGTFDADKPVKGPPTGPIWGRTGSSLAEKITKPGKKPKPDETANGLLRTALKNLDAHPLFWNRSFGKQWPADLPSDFWTT